MDPLQKSVEAFETEKKLAKRSIWDEPAKYRAWLGDHPRFELFLGVIVLIIPSGRNMTAPTHVSWPLDAALDTGPKLYCF